MFPRVTIKQELYHKIETLTKRFKEAGQSLEQIEGDVSEVIKRSTDKINNLLGQIHEANTQVRRFELLDQGKAVSYRDERQKLFEELGGYINFSQEDDISANTGKTSGFVNLFIDGQNKDHRLILLVLQQLFVRKLIRMVNSADSKFLTVVRSIMILMGLSWLVFYLPKLMSL